MYLVKIKRSPFYQIVYRNSAGGLTTKSTGTSNKTEAHKYLAEFAQNNVNKKKSQNQKIKLIEFKNEYVSMISSKLTKKYVRYISVSLVNLSSFTGDILLSEIDHRLAEKFILSIFNDSKYAAAATYRTLKAAFSKAVEWKYIEENPFKKFKLPKLPKSFPVFLSFAELQMIIDKTSAKVMKDIFFTAFFTGLRLGELLNLKWTMTELPSGTITLMNSETFITKSKRERVIPINAALAEVFNRIYSKRSKLNPDDYVFLKPDGFPYTSDFVSKTFKKSVKAAGLNDKIHFHTLRHSFASNLIQQGISIFVVKELLGHRDITTTQIYAHLQTKNLFDAVRSIEPEKLMQTKPVNQVEKKQSLMKYDINLN